MLAADTSRKLKKSETCFDKPVLSPSKDSERLFLQPANFCTGAKICARLGVT